MDWLNFKGATPFGKPVDWDDKKLGTCGTLPVRVGLDNGVRIYDSYWRPTEAELAVLLAGGAVNVRLYGVQPAMSMIVLDEVEGEIRA